MTAAASDSPLGLTVADDLGRSRLTVFFRLLLALPHLAWLCLWTVVALLAAVAGWVATLATRRQPALLHGFLARYVRYGVHVYAYVLLAANPFPGFAGAPGSYPVDVEIGGPVEQGRAGVAFRLVLALPALLVTTALIGSSSSVAAVFAFLGWWASLVTGRMPRGFRDLLAYALGYTAQTNAYLFLLTPRYPTSDPARLRAEAPPLPVRAVLADDGRRSRLTAFFRLLLALPHLAWLYLWSVAAGVAALASWFATLATGTPPAALHGFLSAYARYQTHVLAFVLLVANPFPGFVGAPGSYPFDVEIDPPARQSRWLVGFRILLVLPAAVAAGALSHAAYLAAFLGWWASLVTGRMPVGLRNLAAYFLRYNAHVLAYELVLTDRYPYSGPVLAG